MRELLLSVTCEPHASKKKQLTLYIFSDVLIIYGGKKDTTICSLFKTTLMEVVEPSKGIITYITSLSESAHSCPSEM